MRQELAAAREVAARASSTWDKFRKERDFHRMHHKRVAQEKNRLISDIKRLKVGVLAPAPTISVSDWWQAGTDSRTPTQLCWPGCSGSCSTISHAGHCPRLTVSLCGRCITTAGTHTACLCVCMHACVQAHFAKYEPTILELKRKYELAMKEKMLAGLDRDKMAAKVSQLPASAQGAHACNLLTAVSWRRDGGPARLWSGRAGGVGTQDGSTHGLPLVQAHTLEERLKQLHLDQPTQQQPQQQQELQQQQQHKVQGDVRQSSACMSAGARSGSGPGGALAPWPAASRNPYAECEPPMPAQVNSYTCQKSFKVGVSHKSLTRLL